MKVGLSLSRCIKDIVIGAVNPEDVLVIITRTDFNPNTPEDWSNIWAGYSGYSGRSSPDWIDLDEASVFKCVQTLYNEGKIHQPRKFGARPYRLPYHWLETILPSEELYTNPAARAAFDQFKIIAGLTNVSLNNHEP